MDRIIFRAAFERLTKDKDGEIKLILAVPLSDEHLVRAIPIQEELNVALLQVVENNPNQDDSLSCNSNI